VAVRAVDEQATWTARWGSTAGVKAPAVRRRVPTCQAQARAACDRTDFAVRFGCNRTLNSIRSHAVNVRERRQITLESLSEHGEVSVAELSRAAGVSEMTIRRDLEALEREGLLRRVHGGAISAVSRGYEPPFALRAGREPEAKTRIGQLAATLVSEGETAAIDVGTTTLAFARALDSGAGLTVVTPSVRVAELLAGNASMRVILTGGITRPGELSLVGDLAERAFEDLYCDTAFLGVGGIDAGAGLTEFNLDDARVKRAALTSARRCVVLADATKLAKIAFARICPIERVDVLVTDSSADESALNPIRDAGVEVLLA
jgi:DeoR/GlpR family transcriptional regulator of sugar metabolism